MSTLPGAFTLSPDRRQTLSFGVKPPNLLALTIGGIDDAAFIYGKGRKIPERRSNEKVPG
jgi:hypothetical protein